MQAEVEENLSAIKLIAINPNENDEEDAGIPMLRKKNSVQPIDEPPAEEKPQDEAPKEKTISISALDNIITNFTGGAEEVFDDQDLSADLTLLQGAAEGNITLVKKQIEELKTSGRDVMKELNLSDDKGFSALHLASRYNRKNVIKALIDAGADKNLPGADGLTPLHLATKYFYRIFFSFNIRRVAFQRSIDRNHRFLENFHG